MDGYCEKIAAKPEARSVSDMQRARIWANESLPTHDWDTKREALITSRLVAERAKK